MELTKELTEKQVLEFLVTVDKCFPIPLSDKIELGEFAHKLHTKSDIIAFTDNGTVAALGAGYYSNPVSDVAYMTVLAVNPDYKGQSLGRKIVEEFLVEAKKRNFKGVHLYAVEDNLPAMRLYNSLGFVDYQIDNEPRPNDKHLIKYIRRFVKV